jgi:hypothetical protein
MDKVIAKTKYDRKQHKEFYLFHMFHRNSSTYFVIVISLFIIGLAVYNTIISKGDFSKVMFLWVFAAFSIMITPLLMISRINNIVKKETIERKESTDTIEVTKVKITRSTTITEGKAVIGWNQIDCVCETKDYIYIYTGPSEGIFIVKADIIEGSVELFRKLAQNNMKPNRKGKVKYKKYFKENK